MNRTKGRDSRRQWNQQEWPVRRPTDTVEG